MHAETITKEEVSHLMSKAVGANTKNGYTLAGTIFWLEEYGKQYGEVGRSRTWRNEKKHNLLDAFIAGKHDMASKEVTEFISGVIEK